jgi:hypothetical protein
MNHKIADLGICRDSPGSETALKAPKGYSGDIPKVSAVLKKSLQHVDCSVAPNRDALLPIMASAHFGHGDKSKWGYLGSRKAVYDEWEAGKKIPQLAQAFDRTKGQIQELILEYKLYLEALKLSWTVAERAVLLDPKVEFNPPVRFLQTSGHKAKLGIVFDTVNLSISFVDSDAEKRFKHLITKLVISPSRNLGATASFEDVFADYGSKATATKNSGAAAASKAAVAKSEPTVSAKTGAVGTAASVSSSDSSPTKLKPGSLFYYQVKINNALIDNLMKEAASLNCNKFPAAATFLLRNLVETILKEIIDQQKANAASKTLDLEACLNLCQSSAVTLDKSDKQILKEFNKQHINYLNLGAHGNIIPNPQMVFAASDCIDQFVKRNV